MPCFCGAFLLSSVSKLNYRTGFGLNINKGLIIPFISTIAHLQILSYAIFVS